MSPPTDTLPPELAGHPDYEIVRELGRGGMGVVYLANNRLMGRPEVLKVVGRHLIERPGIGDRFLREIRSAAKLQHPNIVTAYAALRMGESLVLAMEYVEGVDLAKKIETNGSLPITYASYFIHQAALGLQHAHERGMVHRDIKPANLILARDGKKPIVKVLDFGLAKVTSEGPIDRCLTREGQMLGTPDYIAPEQIRNAQSADIRADIYSLGCSFYYLLTGGPPFHGEHAWDIYQAHFSMDAQPLNLVRPEVPVELAALVGKMMAKEPNRRFQSPGDVAQALTPFFKNRSGASAVAISEVSPERQTDVGQGTVGPRPLSPEPSPDLPPNVVPTSERAAEHAKAGSIWDGLIDLRDENPMFDTLLDRTPANGSRTSRRRSSSVPAMSRWLGGRGVWAAAGVLLLGLVAAWVVVIKLRVQNGVIVLENVPANALVEVDGQRVTVSPAAGKPVKIEAQPGDHGVIVKWGDVQVLGKTVSVESGKEFKLTIRLEPPARREPTDKPPPEEKSPPAREAHGQVEKVVTDAPPAPPDVSAKVVPKLEVADSSPTPKKDVRTDVGPVDKPGKPLESIKNSVGMTLRLIPAGEFMMGSPDPNAEPNSRPEHKVRISESYFLGATEVTQSQYFAVMRHNPSFFSPEGEGKDKVVGQPYGEYPVEQASWFDAVLFCNALSVRERLRPYYQVNGRDVQIPNRNGPGYRLPTEAEWEYACRGGKSGPYSVGPDPLAEYGWFARNSEGSTHPVGRKRPNEFGLYDMGGNVWEWCYDEFAGEYYKQSPEVDPLGPSGMSTRVVRGGTGWRSPMRASWYSTRQSGVPVDRTFIRGFRVARLQVATRGSARSNVQTVPNDRSGASALISKPSPKASASTPPGR
jgi:serine/threonine protein kinase/formylglycine-generating enzyme required for sulfatase activity